MKGSFVVAFLALLVIGIHSSERIRVLEKTYLEELINQQDGTFQIGVGIWDITGPAAQIGMMGYAMVGQSTAGISLRLRSRAYIFADSVSQRRVVFVSTDSCMIFTAVKKAVVDKLQSLYGTTYSHDNVMLSGTHTHSGPAGYSYYPMYDLTSFGFYEDNFNVIVNGIVSSIQMAHERLSTGGNIYMNEGLLIDSNINRSPTAYLYNPESERKQYQYDTPKEMFLLKLTDEKNQPIGMVNWYSVHGTSMNNTNQLISGDNKGYASYLFEKQINGIESAPGMGPFVAAFAQSFAGDVSPNTRGPSCPDGTPCDSVHSTCDGYSQGCIAKGPGKTDFESCQIIGENQFKFALGLYENATRVNPYFAMKGQGGVQTAVDYVHTFVPMSNLTVSGQYTHSGQTEYTCHGALGDGFAGGTTDGPGDFDFVQATNSTTKNPFWNWIGSWLADPTPQEIACQYPKPILLNTGDIDFPAPWTPRILPLQIFRVGKMFIVGIPAEFTTMSGRRLRNALRSVWENYGIADNSTFILIAGLSNAYSHYVATWEEFQEQRYEAASTLYGPNTLAGYIQEFSKLAVALAEGNPVPPGPSPPDLDPLPNFNLPVLFDAHPLGGFFGEIYQDISQTTYNVGDTVQVIFYGANPRSDFRTQSTYLTVELFQESSGNWTTLLNDGDWDTQMRWQSHLVGESLISIFWEVGATRPVPTGKYRVRTFGTSKDILGTLTPYVGTSSEFQVNGNL